MTWYVAPQLSRQYTGDRAALTRTLTELLASSIRATDRGSVQLRAQRLPESNDPGMLLFSITDTGTGTSPDRRDPAALLHAWELAGRLGGLPRADQRANWHYGELCDSPAARG